jgi:hypothetical protein
MLAEEGSQIRQHAARHHHLLAEEQGGIQEKAVFQQFVTKVCN